MLNKKIIIIIAALMAVAAPLFALTSHKEYSDMSIGDCNSCHASSDVTATHGGMWVREHRVYAERKPNNCSDCHAQSFCLDCHTGGGGGLHSSQSGANVMPKSHRSDWREIHPIKALDNPQSCQRCHDAKRFCGECHARFNRNDLRVLSHRRGFSDTEVSSGGPKHSTFTDGQCQTCHPNSVLPTHQWSSAHAREARKNLASCQSCHPEGEVCLKCHSARSGLMVNPHPRGWDKISGRLGRAGNQRTCVRCH